MAESKKSVWLNYVSEKMVHVNKRESDGKEFANISIACPQSKTGLATIAVNLGQVINSTRKDGTVVEGYKNILLGKPERELTVSVATNKKGTNYKNIKLTAEQVANQYAEERKAYRKAQAEA